MAPSFPKVSQGDEIGFSANVSKFDVKKAIQALKSRSYLLKGATRLNWSDKERVFSC